MNVTPDYSMLYGKSSSSSSDIHGRLSRPALKTAHQRELSALGDGNAAVVMTEDKGDEEEEEEI